MKIDSAPHSDASLRPEPEPPASRPDDHDAAEGSVLAATGLPRNGAPRSDDERPRLSRNTRIGLGIAAVAVVLVFFFLVRGDVQPFLLAAVVSYIVNPLVGVVQRKTRAPRVIVVGAIVIAAIAGIALIVATALPGLRADAMHLSGQLSQLNNYLITTLGNAGSLTVLGIPVNVAQVVQSLQRTVNAFPAMVLRDSFSVASGAVSGLLSLLTFLLSTIYLLLDGQRLGSWVRRRLPLPIRAEILDLGSRVNWVLSEYLRAEVILTAIMGVASFIVLTATGMPFASVLAPIIGFLEIFPIVGPFFAIGLVVLIALVVEPQLGLSHTGYALVLGLIFYVMRQIEDYLIIPSVVGHAVKLHPVLILFSILCGATLGGILGMFLAVPVAGVVKVVGGFAYYHIVGPIPTEDVDATTDAAALSTVSDGAAAPSGRRLASHG